MAKKKGTLVNLIWRFLERFFAQIVTIVVSIILARLLDPEVYGTIALVMVIMTILQVFVDGGFSTALIQKKDADDIDFSSVFFANITICLLLYAVVFFISPLISSFYGVNELTPIIRVLGITIIVSGLKGVQQAYVSRNLLFKRFFFATLIGTIVAAIVGVWMAYHGFGVWALVTQYLVNATIDTLVLWITVKWRPRFVFSFKRLKALFSFGWKIFSASILTVFVKEIRQLIIGKKYSSEDLAFYNRGHQFPDQGTQAINSSIDSVLLPVMSNEQSDKKVVKEITRKAITLSSFCIWPVMGGLFACSPTIIKLLLTEKWLPCVPYLQIFCIVYAFLPIQSANLNAIKALGKSNKILVMQILKDAISLTITIVSMFFGVFWIALGSILSSFISQIINSWPNKKLLNYGYREQLSDILPIAILSVAMGALVWLISLIGLSSWRLLFLQVTVGIIIYFCGAKFFRLKAFTLFEQSIKGFFK